MHHSKKILSTQKLNSFIKHKEIENANEKRKWKVNENISSKSETEKYNDQNASITTKISMLV